MTTIEWPQASLGCPLRAGYTIAPETGLIRTPMESGLARARRRFPRAPSRVNATWMMTGYQYRYFSAWIDQVAQFGAAWFLINLDFGLGRQSCEVRLIDKPAISRVSQKRWQIGLQLEVLPLKYEPLAELELISLWGGVEELEILASATGALPVLDETASYLGHSEWYGVFNAAAN